MSVFDHNGDALGREGDVEQALFPKLDEHEEYEKEQEVGVKVCEEGALFENGELRS